MSSIKPVVGNHAQQGMVAGNPFEIDILTIDDGGWIMIGRKPDPQFGQTVG
ncbi:MULTISPECIES: hypothetical protein [Thalassospira]|uniref:hypothetical protein n=1 Tax=Thalassospira TaxID=168934 RepID=UPI0012E7558E|nr:MULTISPECIES: hypothetical protein [Thalassospira]MBL4841228.1 hypothetical protein [Thalassospira sp.]MBR9781534.1 hypothetical protein [Rhodospirillales bacterium]MBR9814992.1 hypothetical protein [Rhodospirillales bacterium]MCD1594099.1 hypothetical protein [Thalassospira xiamenensis]QPL36501.1 hypothetical protein IT971_04045 [Thalassospira sp. B30-1]